MPARELLQAVDCKAPSNFDPDAYLVAANKRLLRRYALPQEEPIRVIKPGIYRQLVDAAPEECERPSSSEWTAKGLLVGSIIAVPWAAVILWLLVLAMIRSAVRAARDAR